jgi:hypothetical protein
MHSIFTWSWGGVGVCLHRAFPRTVLPPLCARKNTSSFHVESSSHSSTLLAQMLQPGLRANLVLELTLSLFSAVAGVVCSSVNMGKARGWPPPPSRSAALDYYNSCLGCAL